jgi:hypothetical protein
LIAHKKKLGSRPTALQEVDLHKRRERLQIVLDTFMSKASNIWGLDVLENEFGNAVWSDDGSDKGSNEGSDDGLGADQGKRSMDKEKEEFFEPERAILPLPSRMLKMGHRNAEAIRKELDLRKGQANDALCALRLLLAQKSVSFRTKVRPGRSQAKKIQAWKTVGHIEDAVRDQVRIYSTARKAMIQLGASADLLEKYQRLLSEHLKVSTEMIDPSVHGNKHARLPWFWTLDMNEDTTEKAFVEECKCGF